MTATRAPAATREGWLLRAIDALVSLVEEKTDLKCPDEIAVSCGWPRNDRKGTVVGQCWPSKAGSGVSHLFISPLLSDPVVVLGTLLHELVHAADDCASGHHGAFTRAIRALGLIGPATATTVAEGSDLEAFLLELSEELGPYPHRGMRPSERNPLVPKQSARMVKCYCERCGYTLRTTRKWLDVAVPACPDINCVEYGCSMAIEKKDEDED